MSPTCQWCGIEIDGKCVQLFHHADTPRDHSPAPHGGVLICADCITLGGRILTLVNGLA